MSRYIYQKEDHINTLKSWGWNASLEQEYKPYKNRGLSLGRVIKEQRHIYTIVYQDNTRVKEIKGEVSGAFQYKSICAADYPAIGDWVLFLNGGYDKALIERVLPRKSSFSRKVTGAKTEEQIVATNIDIIYLVFGLNGGRNFTSSGLERYLTLAYESSAKPVIILNKADLCTEEERESALLSAESVAFGVDIHIISAHTKEGLNTLLNDLSEGTTIGLTGPSGVGKSTLVNALIKEEKQKTTPQREGDQRGRHTTSHKEMFKLPSGVILIDTPGLKEVQLWGEEESLNETFDDIASLALNCRFKDCHHQGEPGCTVQKALNSGELEHRRYENFLELQKELKYLKARQGNTAAQLEREKWKHVAEYLKSDIYKERRKR